ADPCGPPTPLRSPRSMLRCGVVHIGVPSRWAHCSLLGPNVVPNVMMARPIAIRCEVAYMCIVDMQWWNDDEDIDRGPGPRAAQGRPPRRGAARGRHRLRRS